MSAVMDCFFPPQCFGCEVMGSELFCRVCSLGLVDAGPISLPGFDYAYARYAYDGPIIPVVQALKFHQRPELGLQLGRRLEAWRPTWCQPNLIVPVPSSYEGQLERGYNPSRELARAFPFPVRADAIRRVSYARQQVGLSRRDRLKNQEKAFIANSKLVRGRRVLVVDDVLTTGATLHAVQCALRDGGAESVVAAVLTTVSDELCNLNCVELK